MDRLNNFKPTQSQLAALELLKAPGADRILARGGRRSGKSVAWAFAVAGRALLYPGSKHGIFRNTLNTCRQLLFKGTFIEVVERAWPGYLEGSCVTNSSDGTITFANKSVIYFRGLDENNTTRLRGSEFATIWLNECNEVKDYQSIMTLVSSLNHTTPMLSNTGEPLVGKDGKPLLIKPKLLLDCNPQLNTDWDAQAFKFGVNPASGLPHPDPARWREIKMDPEGNLENQAPGYLDNLKEDLDGMPAAMSTFVLGEWRDNNPMAMFRPDMVAPYAPIERDDLVKVVVAVDPGGLSHSKKSDETGIVVAGQDRQGIVYILADYSLAGTPDTWGPQVIKAYDDWHAHLIVAESNQGGLMVEQTIQIYRRNAPIKLVRAKDGKVSRAGPVSVAMGKKRVRMAEQMKTLEAQMYDFENVVEKRGASPDRVDAMVYAATELLGLGDKTPGKGMVKSDLWFW